MEEFYKDLNRWIGEQRHIQHDEEIKQLADILVEGFMCQLKDKQEESAVPTEDKVKDLPQEFYY